MLAPLLLSCFMGLQPPQPHVDKTLMATNELLSPAGATTAFNGRPVDLCLSADGKIVYVKDNVGLRAFDAETLAEIGSGASKDGTSLVGLLPSPDGKTLYLTNSASQLFGLQQGAGTKWTISQTIELPGKKGASYPCGIALEPGGKALVCLSRSNTLAEVDLATGKMIREAMTGIAPFQVIVTNGRAFVSCQGGRLPNEGERTAMTSGTVIPVNNRDVALTGTVSVIDLGSMTQVKEVQVGLQPGAMAIISPNELAVANANSDSISVLDTNKLIVTRTFPLRLDKRLAFGSMPNGLALSEDGKKLFVSLSGNNAIAQLDLGSWKVEGYIPTAWFPGALAIKGGTIYVANIKGFGAYAQRRKPEQGHNSHDHLGCVERIALPTDTELKSYTATVMNNARVQEGLAALDKGPGKGVRPVPVPAKPGQPSVFKHVVFVIKENRTYDQILGDMKEGDGDPRLCIFGEKITPNAHAIARQFVLLDNYFCNGVLSADGHAWAMEGNVTPYLERAFGGFTRSYDYGSDAITLSSSGQIWGPMLDARLTFRNFGCEDSASVPNNWKTDSIWRSFEKGQTTEFGQDIGIARLRDHSSPDFPGWNMAIPDVLRMDRFLKEFHEWEKVGKMPNIVFIYLPQDHTAGTSPQYPTPASFVADNDLALGRLVDALSHSQFWKDTVLFANEDDPQAGFDHVDGHRSVCYVVSPYTKRRQTIKTFFNQTSVSHTILQIFGLPPINQKIATAPLMTDCFMDTPDFTPYTAIDPEIDMNAINPAVSALKGTAKKWAIASQKLKFSNPDFPSESQDDLLNRILWAAMKGDVPYPSKYAGPHGRGLKKRGLIRDKSSTDKDD